MDSMRLNEIEDMLMAADSYFHISILENYKLITKVPSFENYNTLIETIH